MYSSSVSQDEWFATGLAVASPAALRVSSVDYMPRLALTKLGKLATCTLERGSLKVGKACSLGQAGAGHREKKGR